MTRVAYPPGPKGSPLVGSLRRMQRDPLEFLRRLAADYGDVAHVRLGGFHAFLLSDPTPILMLEIPKSSTKSCHDSSRFYAPLR